MIESPRKRRELVAAQMYGKEEPLDLNVMASNEIQYQRAISLVQEQVHPFVMLRERKSCLSVAVLSFRQNLRRAFKRF